jgi:ubiquinone/menaquinone biosynthesis C-methylase UbiE
MAWNDEIKGEQAKIWAASEGDAWHRRNRTHHADDPVLAVIENLPKPQLVLEVGCGDGWRLRKLVHRYGAEVHGVDLSRNAIDEARKGNIIPKGNLRLCGARNLRYAPSNHFDLVILGFVLYAVDREDLFAVVAEVDRVLHEDSYLIIHDFYAGTPHSRAYSHDKRLRSYKMDYARLFTANPAYARIENRILGTNTPTPTTPDDAISITVLRKSTHNAWPLREDTK